MKKDRMQAKDRQEAKEQHECSYNYYMHAAVII